MNGQTVMIPYGVVKGAGGAWRTSVVPGGQSVSKRARCGPPVVQAAAAVALGRVERRRRPAEQHCCVPSGCSRYAGEMIDPEEPGDAVRVVCSNAACVVGSWMHADCYDDWQQRVLFYIRCCELGRSLLSDGQMSLAAVGGGGVCSPLGGYEAAYRACVCVCGKGILRRDLRYTSPVSETVKLGDITPVAAALLYHPTMQQSQQQQRMRTCSFSSTGSGSTGSAATPPLSPPRPGAFFPPSITTTKPPPASSVSKPEAPSTTGSASPTSSAASPSPPAVQKCAPLPARGNIFEHRADLGAFKAIRRRAQNAYHVRLDDDGPHGNDDVRRLLMRRLSAAGVRRFACVSCRRALPVYDEFPLIDGTFFLSPRHYGTSGCAGNGEVSVEWGGETSASNLSSLATPDVDAANHHPSHVAVPVVYNRRMLYLHAVCLACLGALPEVEDDQRGGRSLPVQTRNKVACRFCGARWTVGECLVLGTMYTYDVFACAPCCAARRACRRCGGPPSVLQGGSKSSAGLNGLSAPPSLDVPTNFSDCSRLAKCSWCGLEDYHFVKVFDEVFVCAQRAK